MDKSSKGKMLLVNSSDSDMNKVLKSASKSASASMEKARQIHLYRLQAIKRGTANSAGPHA